METLTISSFPYYSFEDEFMAYTVGSAFYGIYFVFSFPMFYWLEDNNSMTSWDSLVYASGCGMLILTSLDLVRLVLGIQLIVP